VTFDIDANGILNVSAQDKSTGKQNKITITRDERLSNKALIELMLEKAEKHRHEDEIQRDRAAAKNNLKSFCLKFRQLCLNKQNMEDEKVESLIS
jgi:L1 cell adhesion molecule like protein